MSEDWAGLILYSFSEEEGGGSRCGLKSEQARAVVEAQDDAEAAADGFKKRF